MSNPSTRHPLSRILPSRPEGPMRVPARAIAWFSIAVGLAQLAIPRTMARAAGAPVLPGLTRAGGLREIGTGIGILTSRDPAPWIWGRVAGDVLDIATVGTGLVTARRPVRTLTTLAILIGVTWLDVKVAEAAPPGKKRSGLAMRDYSDRSGFPRSVEAMRGIARQTGKLPLPTETRSTVDSRTAVASAVAGVAS